MVAGQQGVVMAWPRRGMVWRVGALAGAVGASCRAAPGQGAGFMGLGVVPGGSSSAAYGISGDGSAVVGESVTGWVGAGGGAAWGTGAPRGSGGGRAGGGGRWGFSRAGR